MTLVHAPPPAARATLSIIGNSAGIPAPGGACSAYLVQTPATKLLLDCGPGALPRLRTQLRMREIDGIVISHMHTDHFLDLLALNVVGTRPAAGPPGLAQCGD